MLEELGLAGNKQSLGNSKPVESFDNGGVIRLASSVEEMLSCRSMGHGRASVALL